MEYIEYKNPRNFLDTSRHILEKEEVLYGLMLGIVLRLVENPLHYGSQPFLATIKKNNQIVLLALMTPPYKLQVALFNEDYDSTLQVLVMELHKRGWMIPAVLAEEKAAKIFETCWNSVAGTASRIGKRQRIYKLQTVQYPPHPGGIFRQAKLNDLQLLIKWRNAFHDEVFDDSEPRVSDNQIKTSIEEGKFFFWQDSVPVSMAGLTRPTSHGISINDVYTPPEFRRKGYASALVAHLSQYALDNGRDFCSLYTDLGNPISNSIYQKIGYFPVADVMDVVFRKIERQ